MLANNKGTDPTAMMSKPPNCVFVCWIVTDKPTSGKISITQVVYVVSKLDCPLPGRNPSIYVNMLVYQLYMLNDISRCLLSADFYINFF